MPHQPGQQTAKEAQKFGFDMGVSVEMWACPDPAPHIAGAASSWEGGPSPVARVLLGAGSGRTPHLDPSPPTYSCRCDQPLFSPRWGWGDHSRGKPPQAGRGAPAIYRSGSFQWVVFPFLFSGASAPLTASPGQNHCSFKKQPSWMWLLSHITLSFSLFSSWFQYQGDSFPHPTPTLPLTGDIMVHVGVCFN